MKLSKHNILYESEATQFIQDLKKQNPGMEQAQRQGRARLWDRPALDLDTFERECQSRVSQQAYVYQNKLD
jgi:Protein of unknown function (DUF3460)